MSERNLEWRPGSFSKNFSWGQTDGGGLEQLHRAIRVGFEGKLAAVERDSFRKHTHDAGLVDLIPAHNPKRRHKLTPNQVQEVRALCAAKEMTRQQIADNYKVSIAQVHRIATGRQWKNLPPLAA